MCPNIYNKEQMARRMARKKAYYERARKRVANREDRKARGADIERKRALSREANRRYRAKHNSEIAAKRKLRVRRGWYGKTYSTSRERDVLKSQARGTELEGIINTSTTVARRYCRGWYEIVEDLRQEALLSWLEAGANASTKDLVRGASRARESNKYRVSGEDAYADDPMMERCK